MKGQSETELPGPDVEDAYAGRLDKSLQSLQRQLEEHKEALERVKIH